MAGIAVVARARQELFDSLSPEVGELLDDGWVEELDQRFADWEANPTTGVPWSELKAQR